MQRLLTAFWVACLVRAVLLGGLGLGTADATTYYVSKSGSPSNSCATAASSATDMTKAKLTINDGLSCIGAGDILDIRAGVYTESINTPPGGSAWTSGNFVIIQGHVGETVTVRPNTGPSVVFGFFSATQYVQIDNLHLDAVNIDGDGVKIEGNAGNPSHHIRLQNTEVFNSRAHNDANSKPQGILVADVSHDNEFINLDVHHNGSLGTGGLDGQPAGHYCHGIYLGARNNTIDRSQFHDNTGYGVHLYNGNGGASNNVVKNSSIYNNNITDGLGMIISSGSDNLIYNNLIYGNKGGIEVNWGAVRQNIWYNTIYNNRGGNGSGIYINDGQDTTMQNNIIYNNDTDTISTTTNTSGVTTQNHNVIGADPHFLSVSTASPDFLKLSATSTNAINQGIAIGAVSTDKAGVSRMASGAPDIGAYEFGTAVVTPPQTYYTAQTGGSDVANNCTAAKVEGTPKGTIAGGVGCMVPGDTLIIKAGSYAEALINPPGGTSDTARTFFTGKAGDTVTLKPTSGLYVVAFLRAAASWVTVDNLHLDGTNVTSAVFAVNADTGPGSAQGITLTNSEIVNGPSTVDGVFLCATCPGNLFVQDIVHNSRHGFNIKSASNSIDQSQIHHTAGYGVELYYSGDSTAVHDNVVKNTKLFNTGDFAILVSSGSNNTFYNDILYDSAAGFQVDFQALNTNIWNNTIANNHGPNGSGMLVTAASTNLTARNNILWNNDVNSIGGTGIIPPAVGGTTTTASNNNTGTVDPKFALPASGDFHLQLGSPAINQGATIAAVTSDITGITRPQGTAYDQGAYEKVLTGNIPPPVLQPPPGLAGAGFHFYQH